MGWGGRGQRSGAGGGAAAQGAARRRRGRHGGAGGGANIFRNFFEEITGKRESDAVTAQGI